SKSLLYGLRDYNPIAGAICHLTNHSDGFHRELYGILYGGLIITNQHLFEHNNGTLHIKSRHGEFVCKNTTQLEMLPIAKYDMLIIKTPKDFPVSPMKLRFRPPKQGERICMVGTNFQQKSCSSVVSETSAIYPRENSTFWSHWISTKDGQCGFPMVSTADGWIVGIHSLTSVRDEKNYFVAIPENFEKEFLNTEANQQWVKQWKYNPDLLSWGSLWIRKSQPGCIFNPTKLIMDLQDHEVAMQ
nr:Pro [Euphorbia ringspot virus]